MKLFYIANSRIPTEKAHGLQIMKTCEAFGSASVDLKLILPTRKNVEYDGVDVFDHYKVKKTFEIKKIKTFDPIFLLKLPKFIKPPQGTFIKFQTLSFMKSLNKYLNSNKSQEKILYTRDQYLLPLLFKFSRNVVWEAHDLPMNKIKYVRYWKKCSKVITITHGLKNELVELGLEGKNIFVAPDGVDLELFGNVNESKSQVREKLNLPQDKKIVMYTGHLYDWKGAQILAQAASNLDQETELVFLGGTDRDINRFKNKYGHKENVKILGRVEHKEIPNYLSAADVLVLPNSGKSQISAKYTSPLKLFEYMSAGRPIVASELPSLKEILVDGSNSVLVEPDNPKKLADKIKSVLNDKDLAEKISFQAKKEVSKYSWQNRAEIIIKAIKHEV